MTRLAIIGAGAWGTALALTARRAKSDAIIWARDADVVAAVNQRHANPFYLPGIAIDPAIAATTDLAQAIYGADAALLVVPAQFLREVLIALAPHLPPALPFLLCAKGIEIVSLKTMAEVAEELCPGHPLAVLSGPSFAAEVARDLPTAVVIAGRDPALASQFMEALGSARFRPYLSEDPLGVELGGAVKNVLAIACGIVDGRRLGDNARAALITRGLAEMTRLGVAKGARAETFAGLSGLGDLVLTCGGAQSRNHALGLALGQGSTLEAALAGRRSIVEGVATAASLTALAARLEVEMPICAAVEAVLHRGMPINRMIDRLLSRPRRAE
ncbi:MAG TPA: NAD(P)H-dependent glycerol-3-phosphate dehydrogenase [Stellaceae bacterium]|nr:NAD(P)H-dependent glycerol-3-phosphate dehydrogenase [Stellaceae bacterium]